MKKQKEVKRKINKKGLIFLILILYIIGNVIYYVFTLPVKNVIVEGNKNLESAEIIEKSGLDKSTSLFKTSVLKVQRNLKELDLVDKVEVKKSLNGKITIKITENKPLFINLLENKLVLSNKESINYAKTYGVPTLINYVPSDIYDELIYGMNKIDPDIINKISELEYSPDKSGEIVFDDARFLLRMNDGNIVYINTPNITKLNNYNTIYAEVGSKGILLLDSSSQNYIFKKS